jgi:hypothetical protein
MDDYAAVYRTLGLVMPLVAVCVLLGARRRSATAVA